MNKNSWDYIKHLLALAHCGRNSRCYKVDIEDRQMIVAFMKDYYGLYSTIFVSLNGSPPKAYAILKVCFGKEFKLIKEDGELKAFYRSGKNGDEIDINIIKILYLDLTHYRTIRQGFTIGNISFIDGSTPVVTLSLKELLSRKDVIIMNAEAIQL